MRVKTPMVTSAARPYVRWFCDIGIDDVPLVGGKNASVGELYRELRSAGVRVPKGFAVTADVASVRACGKKIVRGLETIAAAEQGAGA